MYNVIQCPHCGSYQVTAAQVLQCKYCNKSRVIKGKKGVTVNIKASFEAAKDASEMVRKLNEARKPQE